MGEVIPTEPSWLVALIVAGGGYLAWRSFSRSIRARIESVEPAPHQQAPRKRRRKRKAKPGGE